LSVQVPPGPALPESGPVYVETLHEEIPEV
jgi:hypothetical protein